MSGIDHLYCGDCQDGTVALCGETLTGDDLIAEDSPLCVLCVHFDQTHDCPRSNHS